MALLIILYFGKITKSFDVLTVDQELEVRLATYGPEIDQSQHVKSVGHIINHFIIWLTDFACCDWSIPARSVSSRTDL